jgi:hypothetical protein
MKEKKGARPVNGFRLLSVSLPSERTTCKNMALCRVSGKNEAGWAWGMTFAFDGIHILLLHLLRANVEPGTKKMWDKMLSI